MSDQTDLQKHSNNRGQACACTEKVGPTWKLSRLPEELSDFPRSSSRGKYKYSDWIQAKYVEHKLGHFVL